MKKKYFFGWVIMVILSLTIVTSCSKDDDESSGGKFPPQTTEDIPDDGRSSYTVDDVYGTWYVHGYLVYGKKRVDEGDIINKEYIFTDEKFQIVFDSGLNGSAGETLFVTNNNIIYYGRYEEMWEYNTYATVEILSIKDSYMWVKRINSNDVYEVSRNPKK